jgi:hypothetical protein
LLSVTEYESLFPSYCIPLHSIVALGLRQALVFVWSTLGGCNPGVVREQNWYGKNVQRKTKKENQKKDEEHKEEKGK